MAKTRNFAEVIRRRLAGDADLAARVEDEAFNAAIAEEIYNARKAAGLTQAQLATMIGTQQPVIARIESADYDGHSLNLLKRIAIATKRRLHVEFATNPIAETPRKVKKAPGKSRP